MTWVNENTSIDEIIEEQGVIQPLELETPDYSYWASQEPLNASYQVRNINGWWGWWKVMTWFNDFWPWTRSITVWFKPKAINVSVRTSNGLAWGSATSPSNQQCVALYLTSTPNSDSQNGRLFRTWSTSWLWSLVSIDEDWFTVSCDISFTITWTAFW